MWEKVALMFDAHVTGVGPTGRPEIHTGVSLAVELLHDGGQPHYIVLPVTDEQARELGARYGRRVSLRIVLDPADEPKE